MAGASRSRLAELLLTELGEVPARWQWQGALHAQIDPVLDELGVDKRPQRLQEELGRQTRAPGPADASTRACEGARAAGAAGTRRAAPPRHDREYDPDTAQVHVRAVEHGCYHLRVDRP
ncbi:hypothetical protein ABZ924_20115 [Streptomyces sp. NPDC046876]|uniref:hypothetical protein n=1 Tax=Streptomyces sp. NPDC046876 TaxID=3155616 RepID=UPI0033C4DBFE